MEARAIAKSNNIEDADDYFTIKQTFNKNIKLQNNIDQLYVFV